LIIVTRHIDAHFIIVHLAKFIHVKTRDNAAAFIDITLRDLR
jgi:hypothetical protein